MILSTNVEVVTELRMEKVPPQVLLQMSMLSEAELKEVLRGTFIQAMTELGFMDELNANNSWAKVSFGGVA